MVVVKFDSVDTVNRTVVMDVDGVLVTRKIASNVTDLDAYIKALAKGLAVEFPDSNVSLSSTSFSQGEVLVDKSNSGVV